MYFIHSFNFFILEIPVIRSAEYKLSIIREICILMFSLYIKMKFKKQLLLCDLNMYRTKRNQTVDDLLLWMMVIKIIMNFYIG